MAGYVKRIALIKTVRRGFSADGGELSGLVKCEAYAGFLKVEASLINFSPLSEGRYCTGVSDGKNVVLFEGAVFEGEVGFDLSRGFAALVCFCKNGVYPVASAVCGDFTGELARIDRQMCEQENAPQIKESDTAFDDEAIAEVNYYELETDEGGGAVCQDTPQEESGFGGSGGEDEENHCADQEERVSEEDGAENTRSDAEYAAANGDVFRETRDEAAQPHLAGGQFYERMKEDIKKIFAAYPAEEGLQRIVEGSRWARIGYGGGKYYAFGVIYAEGQAKFICYAVPSRDSSAPPKSLAGRASYIPVENGGFWVMYQDASTGASIMIEQG